MTKLARSLAILLVALATAMPALAEKIVLQVSDGNAVTWNLAMNVVENLREAYGPGTEIEVVAFGPGINMLKLDAPVASRVVSAQKTYGAKVYACENSMTRNKLTRDDLGPGVIYVKAGIEHIISRQRDGWVNVRP